ncbi:GDSL esterase/lipase At5g03610 [Pyrus x bretschneideri]|uniref:GDSL esterase/lipase At5g03610 n=1 Tax=Pyrus x bretschneideri TaxID=225117 RepID=UPI000511958D|nr:GDSL esterase/lipase At5g03610 [Pyrus x bretschneideri]
MKSPPTVFLLPTLFLFYLLTGQKGVLVSAAHHHHHHHHHHHTHHHLFNWRPTKLFVFGDSYADTGNNRKSVASSWKQPYGITFPGKPCGRFSDGRVLTDFLARFIGVKSPIPYRFRKVGVNHLKYGVNFAYGGTGVFKTSVLDPNMTTQIDFFQKLIENSSIFTPKELHSSVALVTGPGNDYATYVATNGSVQGWQPFITSIVNQLTVNLKRIYALGVGKVVVTALQPLGCLPSRSASFSFQQCNGTENALVGFHNLLLRQAVAKLNNETKNSFIIVDLYASFMSVFKNKGDLGSIKFENPLRPCCIGINSGYFCGSVDESGAKKYTICKNPESAFFWDTAHPTQQGWRAVYSALQATLEQLY